MTNSRKKSHRSIEKDSITTEDEIARLKDFLENPEARPPYARKVRKMKRKVKNTLNRDVRWKVQNSPKKVILLAVATVLTLTLALIFLNITGSTSDYRYTVETVGEPAGVGLPEFITDEMMVALFETQSRYGIPVSTGLAMIIAEGGFGNFGPGGEYGRGLSQLSYEHHNLFGIKYWSGMGYAIGSVDMLTGEQMECGQSYYYEGNFAVFASYRDSIFKRAWMLMRSPYVEHLQMYLNPNDGTYTVEQANAFIYGIRAGGWATDLDYVEKNIRHMEMFDLYRFDNMTFEEFWYTRVSGND